MATFKGTETYAPQPSGSQSLQAEASLKGETNEPSLVVVACQQCRNRKVRCDSTRPVCKNCTRRSEACLYDAAPKRRGPDKQNRKRLYKKRPSLSPPDPSSKVSASTASDQEVEPKRKRARKAQSSQNENRGAVSLPASSNQALRRLDVDADLDETIRAAGFGTLESLLTKTAQMITETDIYIPQSFEEAESLETRTPGRRLFSVNVPEQGHYTIEDLLSAAEGSASELANVEQNIPRGPSSSFNRQTWWDTLCLCYSKESEPGQSSRKIFQDLGFLLDNSIYWLSFIHIPRFMGNLHDPNRRLMVQPSIVLSALAMSTLMKSSETGLGSEGRRFSLWLRDAAQASLDASLNVGWIEPSLVQAAYFIALYEASANPEHSSARVTSALQLLDSLIHALSLSNMDAGEKGVSVYSVDEMPIVSSSTSQQLISPYPLQGTDDNILDVTTSICSCLNQTPPTQPDSLKAMPNDNPYGVNMGRFLESMMAFGSKYRVSQNQKGVMDSPWGNVGVQADWPDPTDTIEIDKEESRRLCWSVMMLISTLREYTPHLQRQAWDLHVTRQENIALLLPGEKMAKNRTRAKDSIWALHCRVALLWNACQRFRHRPDWETRRIELSTQAWMEANSIEQSLAQHTCPVGKGMLYAGREYLFQLKLLISKQFTRLIPIPHTLKYERDSAQEWLNHRAGLAAHARKVVYFVSRFGASRAAIALAKRPLSVWWVCSQIKAGTAVWKADNTFTQALEQSLDFLAIGDFLTCMWQSKGQTDYYNSLREELLQSCQLAGIHVPEAIPIPGLSSTQATMIPSPLLINYPPPIALAEVQYNLS
ncbi:hypothetical protein PIIN_04486 [Serendipita indica DSM 11827]|uniref:Zn(2)-C6 fungal-type domain-containing protein n=1 Tax=Serendipita indica (strain DSM 11827) TaxID=1109443 RepID=G4TGW2_SERID|nr:hypothetical protein PIIN_04486 [Serendipita indica DSM 11827]